VLAGTVVPRGVSLYPFLEITVAHTVSRHSPYVRWTFALVTRLDEPRQLGEDRHGRAAGGIDDRQAKLAELAPIVDGVRLG
jgi:hypothetical protein